jgi:hypothetical protein
MAHHSLPELDSCPKQTGLGGRNADAQSLGKVVHGHLLNVAKHDGVAEQRRDPADLRPQHLVDFPSSQVPFRVGAGGGQLDRLASPIAPPVVQADKSHALPTPDTHETLIFYNSKQPAGEFGLSAESVYLFEGFPACVLGLLLRFPAVAENGSGQIQAPPVMASKQFSKSFLIAVAGCFDKLWIAQNIGHFAATQGATSLGIFVPLKLRLEYWQFVGQLTAHGNLLISQLIPKMHFQWMRFRLSRQGQRHSKTRPKRRKLALVRPRMF